MALIDQQEAVEGVKELFSLGDCFCDEYGIVGMLNSLPPVQPKRGEWIKMHWKAFRCSVCKRVSEYSTNFCPNCGADMRGCKDGTY